MRRVLSDSQLKRLVDHKYSTEGRSLIEPLFQPYWNWLVTKMPLWLAPNLMTISGLAVNVISSLVVVFYSPHATEPVCLEGVDSDMCLGVWVVVWLPVETYEDD